MFPRQVFSCLVLLSIFFIIEKGGQGRRRHHFSCSVFGGSNAGGSCGELRHSWTEHRAAQLRVMMTPQPHSHRLNQPGSLRDTGQQVGMVHLLQPDQHTTNKGISELHPLRDPRSRKACVHDTRSTGKCHAGMLPHLQGHTAMPTFRGTKSLLLTALFQEIKSLFSLKPDHKNKPKETEHLCVPLLVEIQAACRAQVACSYRTLGPDDLGTVAGSQTH